jgi:hypothetical protein
MYYAIVSPGRGGFFDPADHGEPGEPGCTIPKDAVKITEELRLELIDAQSSGGKIIVPGADGSPVAVDPPAPSSDELAAEERQWRDAELSKTDGIVARHRDELEESAPTTLTSDEYAALQAYRRQLRSWPESSEFPNTQLRPKLPASLETLGLS